MDVQVKKTCPECSRVQTIPIPAKEHAAWKAGALIQNALVSLTPAQREVLLTGYCHGCWDTLFPEEEEEECNGICLTGYDIGVPFPGIAYPHPDCPAHGRQGEPLEGDGHGVHQ